MEHVLLLGYFRGFVEEECVHNGTYTMYQISEQVTAAVDVAVTSILYLSLPFSVDKVVYHDQKVAVFAANQRIATTIENLPNVRLARLHIFVSQQ